MQGIIPPIARIKEYLLRMQALLGGDRNCKNKVLLAQYKARVILFSVFFTEFINSTCCIDNPLFSCIKRMT
jgi:hypothetical protein